MTKLSDKDDSKFPLFLINHVMDSKIEDDRLKPYYPEFYFDLVVPCINIMICYRSQCKHIYAGLIICVMCLKS